MAPVMAICFTLTILGAGSGWWARVWLHGPFASASWMSRPRLKHPIQRRKRWSCSVLKTLGKVTSRPSGKCWWSEWMRLTFGNQFLASGSNVSSVNSSRLWYSLGVFFFNKDDVHGWYLPTNVALITFYRNYVVIWSLALAPISKRGIIELQAYPCVWFWSLIDSISLLRYRKAAGRFCKKSFLPSLFWWERCGRCRLWCGSPKGDHQSKSLLALGLTSRLQREKKSSLELNKKQKDSILTISLL